VKSPLPEKWFKENGSVLNAAMPLPNCHSSRAKGDRFTAEIATATGPGEISAKITQDLKILPGIKETKILPNPREDFRFWRANKITSMIISAW
jgi:hypothetical protein